MNLGQVFGEMQLRIYQIEEELEGLRNPHPNHGRRYNLIPRVRALLAERGPMTIDEISRVITDVRRPIIGRNIQVACAKGLLGRIARPDGFRAYTLLDSSQVEGEQC